MLRRWSADGVEVVDLARGPGRRAAAAGRWGPDRWVRRGRGAARRTRTTSTRSSTRRIPSPRRSRATRRPWPTCRCCGWSARGGPARRRAGPGSTTMTRRPSRPPRWGSGPSSPSVGRRSTRFVGPLGRPCGAGPGGRRARDRAAADLGAAARPRTLRARGRGRADAAARLGRAGHQGLRRLVHPAQARGSRRARHPRGRRTPSARRRPGSRRSATSTHAARWVRRRASAPARPGAPAGGRG